MRRIQWAQATTACALSITLLIGCGQDSESRDSPSAGDGDTGDGDAGDGDTGDGDTGDGDGDLTPPDPQPTVGSRMAVKRYTACEVDAECEDGLSCIDLLGSRICSVTGCDEVPDLCEEGETCIVSPALSPDGVCAFTGTDQFCARNCRDPLVCNLRHDCATAGCCGDLDSSGCPTQCAEMDAMSCEISPQCPVQCCTTE